MKSVISILLTMLILNAPLSAKADDGTIEGSLPGGWILDNSAKNSANCAESLYVTRDSSSLAFTIQYNQPTFSVGEYWKPGQTMSDGKNEFSVVSLNNDLLVMQIYKKHFLGKERLETRSFQVVNQPSSPLSLEEREFTPNELTLTCNFVAYVAPQSVQ